MEIQIIQSLDQIKKYNLKDTMFAHIRVKISDFKHLF